MKLQRSIPRSSPGAIPESVSAGTGSQGSTHRSKRLTGRSRAQAGEGGLALVKPGVGPQNRLNSAPVRRIGYVLDRFPRASHDFVLQEILELQSRGIEVHIFSLGLPDGRIDDTTAALARLRGPVSYFLAEMEEDAVRTEASASQMMSTQACWIANQLTAARIEHLHAHLASAPTDVLREVRRLTGVPYSFTAHSEGLYEEEADYRLREKVADAKFVVALTEFDRGHLLRVCGADAGEKIQSIHMGIDLDECRFSAAECHDSDSVLAVGPLVEKSGFTDLIDAIAMLRDRGHAARLTIVGEGEFEEELRAQIQRCGLGDRVNLLGGRSRYELGILMRVHTVLALPWVADERDRDVLANLVLEAMAVGLVVISIDLPGIRELVDDGMNGRLIRPRDPLWLAGALETLLDNPGLRQRMALQARAQVERRYAAASNASDLARLFNETVIENRIGT
jgi:glycosyltransferase involved in cell wall biosynthesis